MPATAASAEPMAKVMEIVWLTLMPISEAAPRSSDTQRMALPVLVLLVKAVSAIMMTMLAAMVTSVAPVIFSSPPNREMVGILIMLPGKLFGFAPQIISAMFCRR